MGEHTPTPWFKNRKLEIGPRPRTDDQHDGMLHPVADVFGDNGEANAAFIVKAVNNHDALVKALRLAQGYISYDTDIPKADEILAKIGAALGDVEGSPLAHPEQESAPASVGGLRLGDMVRVNEKSPFFHDWRNTKDLKLVSLRVDPDGKQWASVIEGEQRHRGNGTYDGEATDFDADHLSPAAALSESKR